MILRNLYLFIFLCFIIFICIDLSKFSVLTFLSAFFTKISGNIILFQLTRFDIFLWGIIPITFFLGYVWKPSIKSLILNIALFVTLWTATFLIGYLIVKNIESPLKPSPLLPSYLLYPPFDNYWTLIHLFAFIIGIIPIKPWKSFILIKENIKKPEENLLDS